MRRRLQPQSGVSLTDQLFAEGLELPCGGDGTCGRCRVRLVSGTIPVTDRMRAFLTDDELSLGWRLGCQASATDQVDVELDGGVIPTLGDGATLPIEPRPGRGAVIDLGTTTVVVQIVDLTTGEIRRVASFLNPQARHGSDVMSRLAYERDHPGELCRLIRSALAEALGREPLADILVVGNTAMHHLVCGIDSAPLLQAPFDSPSRGPQVLESEQTGWPAAAEILPCLGGFVGSDILAGIIATDLDRRTTPAMLVDAGTNGEVVVGSAHGLVYASAAAGPAFEGSRISCGIRAGQGAIHRVELRNGGLLPHVLGGGVARGLCGSGLVDAVAGAVELGLVLPNGRIANTSRRLTVAPGIELTQQDIRELQLAKGAVAAAITLLAPLNVERLLLAGAFGSGLHIQRAQAIGLVPSGLPVDAVGNTALRGVRQLLLAPRHRADRIASVCRLAQHVELAGTSTFMDTFIHAMTLCPFPLAAPPA